MTWESFGTTIIRNEYLFAAIAVTVVWAVIMVFAVLVLRIFRVGLKLLMIAVFAIVVVILLLQIASIADNIPRIIVAIKNTTFAGSLESVTAAWSRAKLTYQALPWASQFSSSVTAIPEQPQKQTKAA